MELYRRNSQRPSVLLALLGVYLQDSGGAAAGGEKEGRSADRGSDNLIAAGYQEWVLRGDNCAKWRSAAQR